MRHCFVPYEAMTHFLFILTLMFLLLHLFHTSQYVKKTFGLRSYLQSRIIGYAFAKRFHPILIAAAFSYGC
jgi:hypothetical protein